MTAGNDGRRPEEREERLDGRPGERPDERLGERLGDRLGEEEALRRLMRDVVSDIEPGPSSLDHIRRALPARRARRRQTLIGAAAAVLVMVTIPALMQAGVVPGPLGPDEHGSAAHSEQTGESGEQSSGEQSSGSGSADKGGKDPDKGGGSESGGGQDMGEDAAASPSEGGSTESPGGSDGLPSTSPRCSRDQLGNGAAQVGAPDDQGEIYGSFRLANVSGDTCRIKGTDTLVAVAQGQARDGGIQVLNHTEGGKAEQLPSPSEASDDLILRSGEAYQVRFAWVPDNERGPGGCTPPDPEPDPEPDDPGDDPGGSGGDTAGGASEGDETNEASTLGDSGTGDSGGSGDTGDGSETGVTLRYTPPAGEPQSSQAFLNDVCSGTVYRTGPLPAA